MKPKDDTADVQEESKLDGPGLEGLGFITVTVYLDRYNPLTEAKWVRTGTPDDWIASVLGNLASTPPSKPQHQEKQSADLPDGEASSAATTGNDSSNVNTSQNQASCAWKGKIKVADPDAVRSSSSSSEGFHHVSQNRLRLLSLAFFRPFAVALRLTACFCTTYVRSFRPACLSVISSLLPLLASHLPACTRELAFHIERSIRL